MEQYKVETIEYKGYEIHVYQDPDPESPREWDNLGTMTCFHRRYELGDKHSMDIEELKELVARKDVISLPLFLIDHSGVSMNTGGFSHCDPQGWDWGQVGYIYVTREDALKEFGKKKLTRALREKVRKILEGEVEAYDQYLTGQVYGYVIERNGEHFHSCWGFSGDPKDHLIPEAKSIIDHLGKEKKTTVFRCAECGHEQEVITQQECHTRYPNGLTEYEQTLYVFECGHVEESRDDLLVVDR